MEQTQNVADQTATTVLESTIDPFDEGSWSEKPVKAVEPTQTAAPAATQQQTAPVITDAPNDLKTHLGYDKWEDAKTELETLRKLKDTPPTPQEIKFANEESKRLHEAFVEGKEDDIYDFLDRKRKINRLSSLEVNESTAADIVKAHMKHKYRDLNDSEIAYKFNKAFTVPPKPEQLAGQDETEYEIEVEKWGKRVDEVKMELLIEAKMAKPEIDKLKLDLVPPDIAKKSEVQVAPTQEELDSAKKYYESYLQNTKQSVKNFNGFTATYKDEEAQVESSYVPSEEERLNVETSMQIFAENGFDANAIFAKRWLNADKTLNTDQMAKDLSLIESGEKITQKLVNDSVTKRLTEYRQKTSNIKVDGNGSSGAFQPDNTQVQEAKRAEHFFSN